MAFGLDTGPESVVHHQGHRRGRRRQQRGQPHGALRRAGCGFYRGEYGQAGAGHVQRYL